MFAPKNAVKNTNKSVEIDKKLFIEMIDCIFVAPFN